MAFGGFRSCYIISSPLVKASFPVISGMVIAFWFSEVTNVDTVLRDSLIVSVSTFGLSSLPSPNKSSIDLLWWCTLAFLQVWKFLGRLWW
ncbi:hypothetical protein Bca4012_065965 [Brassica carinata]